MQGGHPVLGERRYHFPLEWHAHRKTAVATIDVETCNLAEAGTSFLDRARDQVGSDLPGIGRHCGEVEAQSCRLI